VRIGSLRYDLPVGFEVKLAESFKKVRSLVSMVDRLLSRNRIFLNRMYGVATITPEEALSYGLTGPLLRASGVNYDVRKAFPYCSYEDFDFEVPLGVNGDNYDRYQVRMLEIEQSLRIAEQALSKMPAGEISAEEPAVVLPDKEQVYNTIEGEIRHFKLIIDGVQPPAGEVYLPVEGGNGELAFYTVSDGSGHPYRVHVRAPSFVAMGIFKELLKGLNLADIIATFGMINMIGGECDR
jgi:NADH-quinone oxidoreductase subunit D